MMLNGQSVGGLILSLIILLLCVPNTDPHHPSMQGKGGSLESPLDLSQGSSRYQDPDAQPEGGAEGRPGSHGRAVDPNRRPSVEEMRRKKKKAYLKVKMKTMHGMGAAMRGEVRMSVRRVLLIYDVLPNCVQN